MHGSFQGTEKRRRTTTTATQHKTRADKSPGPCEVTSRVAHTHFLHSHLETWEPLPLSHPLVTPTTSTSVQDNTELASPTGRRAFLGPSINCPYSYCTPSGPRRADTYYSLVLGPSFLTPTVVAPGRGRLHVMTNHFCRSPRWLHRLISTRRACPR
jgi:hypothetical protein